MLIEAHEQKYPIDCPSYTETYTELLYGKKKHFAFSGYIRALIQEQLFLERLLTTHWTLMRRDELLFISWMAYLQPYKKHNSKIWIYTVTKKDVA